MHSHYRKTGADALTTVCEDTGCGKLEFNSCHNVSKADFESGVSYLDLMWANVDTVRKALG